MLHFSYLLVCNIQKCSLRSISSRKLFCAVNVTLTQVQHTKMARKVHFRHICTLFYLSRSKNCYNQPKY